MDVALILISWLILLVPGFDDSVPPTGDKVFKIETHPDIVESIKVQPDKSLDFLGFDVELKQNSTGILEIKIPKNLPTPASFTNSWHHDENPIVLTDGAEIGYDVIPDPCYSHYKIHVEGETNLEILYPVILAGSWQLYSPVQFDENNPCYDKVFHEKSLESPLKQFKSGVPIYEIQCKETLLLIKKHDATPVCVTPETREKLKERGWDASIIVAVNREAPTVYLEPVDISSANNQFAIDFYSNLTQNDSTSNVFFSPTSISGAFSILYEGARQNTSQEIQSVFGFPEDEQKRRSGYLSLHQSINEKNNTNISLSIANALWLAENFEPLAEYIDIATTFYDSTVDTVNFASNDGINKINAWVDEKTQGKIPDILKPGSTSSNTKMAITNAIYFKGLWEYPFDPEDTYESEFMIDKDNSVNVQMMTFPHKMQVNYAITEKMEMIELPYRNDTVSLLIILPNEIGDLRAVEESITIDNLKMWQDFPTVNRGINIHIPKFTLETEYDLKQQLPDMGMPTVFDPVHADLSGITGYKSLYVSQAIHKAFVEVNEKGTEAAGATVIVTDESGGQTFRVDHPFVFIIQDNETDNILFMGRVVNPLQ